MALVLWLFLLFTSLYHVLVTVLVYGVWLSHPEVLVIIRDGLWLLFFLVLVVVHRKIVFSYLLRTWKLWWVFIVLSILGVGISYLHGKALGDIIVGAKYGLQFFVIFLTAVFVWQVCAVKQDNAYSKILKRLFALLLVIMILWFFRQWAKMLWPEIFYRIGYAPLGDWVFGQNPPLYYLTWPWGYARLSGIFSWPNNYGYLFVGVFGLRWWYIRSYVTQKKWKIMLWILFALSVVWTLSRGAIIGIFFQMIALSFVFFHAKRRYIWFLIFMAIWAVVALSLVKWGSTLEHMRTKFSSLTYVIANPWGYGLGSSWPSIHTGHGNILPENFFVQILIDIWVPGLLLWFFFWYLVLRTVWKTRASNKSGNVLLVALSFSFLGMLLEWMFLHVFEDSMVNYWFFIIWWLVYGRATYTHSNK